MNMCRKWWRSNATRQSQQHSFVFSLPHRDASVVAPIHTYRHIDMPRGKKVRRPLHHVKVLCISGSRNASDETTSCCYIEPDALDGLVGCFSASLEQLQLTDMSTDFPAQVVEWVGSLGQLKFLSLQSCDASMTERYLTSKCYHRHMLQLQRIRISGVYWFPLKNLAPFTLPATPDRSNGEDHDDVGKSQSHLDLRSSKCRHLEFDLCGVKEVEFRQIAMLRWLTSLTLNDCLGVNDQSLAQLAESPTLRSQLQDLYLARCEEITDTGLSMIATELVSVLYLSLRKCRKLTDAGLMCVAQEMPQLRSLDVSGTIAVGDMWLPTAASSLGQLRYLNLDGCKNVTEPILEVVGSLGELEYLGAAVGGNMRIDGGESMMFLMSLRRLTYVNLSCTTVSTEGLLHLHELRSTLLQLRLEGCYMVDDEGLQYVGQLTELVHLNLRSCQRITDAGILHLRGLQRLRHLNIAHCHCLRVASMAILDQLVALTALEYCEECRITSLTSEQLLAAHTRLTHATRMECHRLLGTVVSDEHGEDQAPWANLRGVRLELTDLSDDEL